MTSRRALLASICACALLPTTASAATVTVTGDDGTPLTLNPSAPAPIRNMSPEYVATFGASDGAYHRVSSVGPDGAATSDITGCYPKSAVTSQRRPMYYRGNGLYAVVVETFTNSACTAGRKETRFLFSINAGTGIGVPAQRYFLTREARSFRTIVHRFGVGLNPGTNAYEFKYAKNGIVGPDGSLQGDLKDPFVDREGGYADLTFTEPGTYTAVVRGITNQFGTPWSAPVTFSVKTPFDLSYVGFPDSRGPSYKLQGTLRERGAARGNRVRIYYAKGRKGGKFRRLGRSSKVNSRGRFTLRFRMRPGSYRLQYRYKGSKLMAAGKETRPIRITRRFF